MTMQPEITPTELTRDQLLVFNTMCWLAENIDDEELRGFIAAFEHDDEARAALMTTLTAMAEAGHQKMFTTPPVDEQH
jgi:hypothetical protein